MNISSGKVTCGAVTGASAASSTLLGDNNHFTGLSNTIDNLNFTLATGTSATTTNFFSTTASSTNLFATVIASIGNITSTGLITATNFLANASTTLQNFTFVNATGSQATTTNFFSTKGSFTTLCLTGDTCRTTWPSGSGGTSNSKWSTSTDNISIYVNSAEKVGIGTSTPRWSLQVASATPYFAITDNDAATNAKHLLQSYIDGIYRIGTSSDDLTSTSSALELNPSGSPSLGIGTSTPQWALQVSVSGKSQITISDAATLASNHWSIRNAGGFFYVATSSPSTYATSTASILSIDTNGIVTLANHLIISGNSTTTNATTTAIFSTTASSTSLFATAIRSVGNITSTGVISASAGSAAAPSFTFGYDTDSGMFSPAANMLAFSAGGTELLRFASSTFAGLGTTSPQWLLQLASSTKPQLTLSDGVITDNHWSFRNAGGNFYLATSSPSTFATSSTPTLTIIPGGISGFMGLSSSTPWGKFSVEMGVVDPSFVVANSGSTTPSFIIQGVNSNGSVGVGTATPSTRFAFSVGGSTFLGTGSGDDLRLQLGTISYTRSATTTIQKGINQFSISTSTATGAQPIFSISTDPTNGATSTVSFFTATSTSWLVAGGTGASSTMKHMVIIGSGASGDEAGLMIARGGLCVALNGGCQASTTGRIVAEDMRTTSQNWDIAEMYPSNGNLTVGQLVAIDSPAGFVKLANPGDVAIGIVSTHPAFLVGDVRDIPNLVPIALAGRVPVNVSAENGPIKAGDYLTLSSIPGVAAKANKAGATIAQAMESFDGPGTGSILVFIKSTYYSGPNFGDLPGLTTNSVTSRDILSNLSNFHTDTSYSDLSIDRLTAGVEIVTPKITTTSLYAGSIDSPTLDALRASIISSQASDTSLSNISNIVDALTGRVSNLENMVNTHFDFHEASTTILMDGLEVNNKVVLNGGLVVNSIGDEGQSIDMLGDTVFIGRPYFTKDTAGSALIKTGARSVEVVFDRDYVGTPIVGATIALESGSTTDTLENAIFDNDIRYIVTKKSVHGFTILLNKPAPGDVGFSWTAFATKGGTLFTSRDVTVSPIVVETSVLPDASGTSTTTSTTTTEISGDASTVSPVPVMTVPEISTSTADQVASLSLPDAPSDSSSTPTSTP
ncbi:hypothetical protein KW790_01930 [Candidatus Parcubacteria bacterium]|nr:hypothetical protein [Candidatus Parcubacteria bacterium]